MLVTRYAINLEKRNKFDVSMPLMNCDFKVLRWLPAFVK